MLQMMIIATYIVCYFYAEVEEEEAAFSSSI